MKTKEAAILEFDHLLEHYRPMILSLVRASYISNMPPEDMAQELRIVLWKCHRQAQAGRIRNKSFDGYLRLCMLNRLIDLTKSAACRPSERPLEDAGDLSGDHSCKAMQGAEFRADLESVPMSDDAKLLVRIVLADARNFREAFMQQAGGRGCRARYSKVKSELKPVLAPYR